MPHLCTSNYSRTAPRESTRQTKPASSARRGATHPQHSAVPALAATRETLSTTKRAARCACLAPQAPTRSTSPLPSGGTARTAPWASGRRLGPAAARTAPRAGSPTPRGVHRVLTAQLDETSPPWDLGAVSTAPQAATGLRPERSPASTASREGMRLMRARLDAIFALEAPTRSRVHVTAS